MRLVIFLICTIFLLSGARADSGVGQGSVAELQAVINDTLDGGPSTAVDIQRTLCRLLRWTDRSDSGVVVGGFRVRVRDLDRSEISVETGSEAPIDRYFEVKAQGPAPVRVHVPVSDPNAEYEVYRKVSAGTYLKVGATLVREKNAIAFESASPGSFVTREVDEFSYPLLDKGFFDFTPPSSDPAAKAAWRLYRVEPERVYGPIPLVLIAGAGTDRWADFVHWAAYSPDADAFREAYQLWDYYRPSEGVDAAIGFSAEYPAYEESIVAYLDRFLSSATTEGVETDGIRYYFPAGPYSIITHSHGGIVARAFLKNYPEHAARVLGVVSLNAPHLGTPFATFEWTHYTITQLGFSSAKILGQLLDATVGELMLNNWLSPLRQSDLDMTWGNFDAASGFGLPYRHFRALRFNEGLVRLTVSPRDANQTGAREWPGYDDDTFTPQERLSTYCGALDLIQPAQRGDLHLDKFFLYGSYMLPDTNVLVALLQNSRGVQDFGQTALETLGQLASARVLGLMETPGTDAPLGAYLLNDGVCPLQSMLMLDGTEGDLIYETEEVDGYWAPKQPLTPRMDLIEEHTLGDPSRIRILEGWNHLETVLGRYNARNGRSDLFSMVAADLLSVLPQPE